MTMPTRIRGFRVDDPRWNRLSKQTHADKTTNSAILRKFIDDYTGHDPSDDTHKEES